MFASTAITDQVFYPERVEDAHLGDQFKAERVGLRVGHLQRH